LTLPTAKAGGFSVPRHVPAFAGLTVSPRAFSLSVCPAARCSNSGVSRRAEMFRSVGLVIASTCYDTRVHSSNQYRSPYIPMPKGRGFTATFGKLSHRIAGCVRWTPPTGCQSNHGEAPGESEPSHERPGGQSPRHLLLRPPTVASIVAKSFVSRQCPPAKKRAGATGIGCSDPVMKNANSCASVY